MKSLAIKGYSAVIGESKDKQVLLLSRDGGSICVYVRTLPLNFVDFHCVLNYISSPQEIAPKIPASQKIFIECLRKISH